MLLAGAASTAATAVTGLLILVLGTAMAVPQRLDSYIGMLAALVVVRAGLAGLVPTMRARASAAVREHTQAVIYRQLLDVGPAVFDTRRTGDLSSLATDAVGRLSALAGTFVPLALRGVAAPVLVAICAMVVDLWTGAVLVAAIPVVAMSLRGLERGFRIAGDRLRVSQDGLAAEFLDAIQGLDTLVAYDAAADRGDHLAGHAEEVRADTMDLLRVAQRGLIWVDLVYTTVSVVVVVAFVAWRIGSGAIDGAGAVTLALLSAVSISALVDVVSFFYVAGLGLAAFRRLKDLFAIPTLPSGEAPANVAEEGSVLLEDVTYSYPGANGSALDGIRLSIEPGTSLALVGRSGAGKSTIASLVLGLRNPDAGRVLIDGVDITATDRAWLARRVTGVGQATHLFTASVADNLRIARPEATPAEMEAACRRARVLDVVESLPDGFDTVLGERGRGLSGGEAQRLAIARALLAGTPIVVLDEATSGLDLETEALVADAIGELMTGRTTIIIAHRITTARRCDRVIQIEDGRIVAAGRPGELGEGFFARMAEGAR